MVHDQVAIDPGAVAHRALQPGVAGASPSTGASIRSPRGRQRAATAGNSRSWSALCPGRLRSIARRCCIATSAACGGVRRCCVVLSAVFTVIEVVALSLSYWELTSARATAHTSTCLTPARRAARAQFVHRAARGHHVIDDGHVAGVQQPAPRWRAAAHRKRAAHVAVPFVRRSSAVCEGVSRTRRTGVPRHRNLRACARRSARCAAAWLKPRSRKRAGVQRHRHQQPRQRRGALRAPPRQQHAEHARVGDDALVFELADQVVDRRLEAQRRSSSAPWIVAPGKIRVADAAEIEIQRGAFGKPHRQQRGGNSVAASSRDSARGAVNLKLPPLVDNGFAGSRTCPQVFTAPAPRASRKTDANQ